MRSQKVLSITIFVLSISILSARTYSAHSEDAFEIRAVSERQEGHERDVDAVAMASQEQAISKLSSLLSKYRNTSQEPILLAKLAELQQQNAAIVFRIAHGKAHHSNKAIDLSRYKKMENDAIVSLTTLIGKYPSFSEIAHAYFIRGKAYEELENKPSATKDYLYLTTHFPLAEESTAAYMSLADFAVDANEHAKAITYLKEVEKHPDDNHYPFALYKLAWSYYNLKDIPSSLKYAEKQIHFYDDLTKNAPEGEGNQPLSASDYALRENTLLDSAVFYFEGYEQNPDTYSPAKAFDYFRGLEKGKSLGKMLNRYSKLLRSHAHDHDLVAWKDIVLKSELAGDLNAPESLDIVLNTFEHLLNRRDYVGTTQIAKNIVELYQHSKTRGAHPYDSMPKAQKTLLDTADGLQQLIVKNKENDQAKGLSAQLADLYFDFTQIVDDTDPRIRGAHYNLAETLFTIKKFEEATQNYRWIVEHGKWKKPDPKDKSVSVADASLKAIASRYEVLETKQLLPKDIKPVSIGENSEAKLDPLLGEWIQWIDTHVEHSQEGTENFVFEANRALYHHGHILESLKRMNSFAEDHPKSDYAIPSASLVLDTFIATADWQELIKKTDEYMDVDEWKSLPFNKRLFTVSADASYKLVEVQAHAKNYPETLKLADAFLKKYSKSERFADTLVLAGGASLESQQPDLAYKYFTRLINEAPNSSSIRDALLARASIEENKYALADAGRDYLTYLKLPTPGASNSPGVPKDTDKQVALKKKILAFAWINADWPALKDQLESKNFCSEGLATECDRYQALGIITRPELFKLDLDKVVDRAKEEKGEMSALWSAVALTRAKDMGFHDRLMAIRHLAKNYDDIEAMAKFAILPSINETIPAALELNRLGMNDFAPLRASEKYITHRVDVMREMENAVTAAMNLPWARIKSECLNELASTYHDFSATLEKIEPKGLKDDELAAYQDTIRKITVPFDEKGQDLRSKAFQLASHYAIENTAFQDVAGPFFADNPSQAKALKKGLAGGTQPASVPATPSTSAGQGGVRAPLVNPMAVASAVDLDINFLDVLDPEARWKKKLSDSKHSSKSDDSVSDIVAAQFVDGVQHKNWPKLAFYLQEAKAKKLFKPNVLSALKGISLTTAGAKAEALLELEDSRQQWEGKAKLYVLAVLSRHYEQSYAIDRAQTFNKEIETELTPKVQVTENSDKKKSL
jgi:TolA-binding protein